MSSSIFLFLLINSGSNLSFSETTFSIFLIKLDNFNKEELLFEWYLFDVKSRKSRDLYYKIKNIRYEKFRLTPYQIKITQFIYTSHLLIKILFITH